MSLKSDQLEILLGVDREMDSPFSDGKYFMAAAHFRFHFGDVSLYVCSLYF